MANFQREKDILHRLVRARNAIKYKYDLIKRDKSDRERILNETFKPIVDPLRLIASKDFIIQNKAEQDEIPVKKETRHVTLKKEVETQTHRDYLIPRKLNFSSEDENISSDADPTLREDNPPDEYLDIVKNNDKSMLDLVYGVRKDGNKFVLGKSSIDFDDESIKIDNKSYPRTKGLMELLILKDPAKFTSNDKRNYKHILTQSGAHKKKTDPSRIRIHNSSKFNKIIGPMFNITSEKGDSTVKDGGSLPQYKIAKKNVLTDYRYWDDPNELVDRLRLLIAEREAGNPSHNNEILAIIEELREADYIY